MNRWLATTALLSATLAGLASPARADETQKYAYDALGRLIAVQYSGSINNGQAHSLCYDPAGNRVQYKSSSLGSLASCGGSTPTPSPTPTPTNNPPTTKSDYLNLPEWSPGSVDVVINDSDPDGDYPLKITAISDTSGYAYVANSTTIGWNGSIAGTYYVTYTIQDSRGATATGTLTVTVSWSDPCGGQICQ